MSERNRWFVVDVQQICILDGGKDFAEAQAKADARVREGNLPPKSLKVMTHPRVGTVTLDPKDPASYEPRRSANPARKKPESVERTPEGWTVKQMGRMWRVTLGDSFTGEILGTGSTREAALDQARFFWERREPKRNPIPFAPRAPEIGSMWMLRAPSSVARRNRVYVVRDVNGGRVEYEDATNGELSECSLAKWHELMTQSPEHTRNNPARGRAAVFAPKVGSTWVMRTKGMRGKNIYTVVKSSAYEVTLEGEDGYKEKMPFEAFAQVFSPAPQANPGELMIVNPTENPDGGLDTTRAEKTYEMWHKREPRNAKVVRPRVKDNDLMCCVGNAHSIIYASNKWEKDLRKTNSYIHHFDSSPKVWMLVSKVPDGDARGNGSKTVGELLKGCRNADGQFACADLARAETLCIDAEDNELKIGSGARLLGATDHKTVIILDPQLGLVIVKGGAMHFDERGIIK